jgi:hypothetical protein
MTALEEIMKEEEERKKKMVNICRENKKNSLVILNL